MDKHFETLRAARKLILNITADLSIEELNTIPTGFNNNIIWNMGHLVATQQNVSYRKASLDMKIEDAFFEAYKPDTKPVGLVGLTEVEVIKDLLISTINQLEADYKNNIFTEYEAWTTRSGIEIVTSKDTFSFLLLHDGMHAGYIMALKRLVKGA